ncbi:metal-dependent hydrolase [Mangrovivirga sp. M17]|uniref:Metal-dependent hydrolase n=1 Tax=Mangrovivirga halotolerans TaxID=2993936 RepID=A0ABT3RMM1_9BACT|nr:metal-dependent hydrolase [Mangrovivirga halotolerans]MCX2742999.1 metal-dependent hydrolase [Mangrovivirga halotolerans]
MASLFGHAFAASSLASVFPPEIKTFKVILLGIICSVLPDIDVLAFSFGIPYENLWGHRGITHSLFFSFLIGVILVGLFYRKFLNNKAGLALGFYFFLCSASHIILDAMTTGGLGVAVFAPFDTQRYFLPVRPIKVSPIGVGNFFTDRGLNVIKSELIWIGIPGTLIIILSLFSQLWKKSKAKS